MADDGLVEVFQDCLARLAAGEGVVDCLRAYPQYARELEPMLEAALLAKRARSSVDETARAQDRVRFRFRQALAEQRIRPQRIFLRRLLALAASIVLLFGLAGGAITILAQNSLPGDALYGVKRLTEELRLELADDSAALQMEFAQRRIAETRELLNIQREAETQFQGVVENIKQGSLIVAGFVIRFDPSLPGANAIEVGDRVAVRAITTVQNELIALELRVIEPEILLTPVILSTPTATPTSTVAPTATATSRPSATATATSRPSATATATPSLTGMPIPVQELPSATVIPSRPLATQEPTRAPLSPTPIPTSPQRPASPRVEPATRECVVAPPSGWILYRLREGDILARLAQRAGTTVEEIARVNCLRDRAAISPGSAIYLPRPDNPPAPIPSTPARRGG